MPSVIKIAFRSLIRNGRRSLTIGLAIATGTIGLLCFGQFIGATLLGFQSSVVRNDGHLSIFHKGYSDFGAGNPTAYAIADYARIENLIRHDPELGPLVHRLSPRIRLYGVASNGQADASATFFGVGVVPDDILPMKQWDDYKLLLHRIGYEGPEIREDDPTVGVIGRGMARLLGLCGPLQVPDCPPLPPKTAEAAGGTGAAPPLDLGALAARDVAPDTGVNGRARVDLLTATAQGAPNVATIRAVRAEPQAVQALDDTYVRMNFSFAQALLFGRGEPKATSIVVQLNHTRDLERSKVLLAKLFAREGLALEVRDFRQLNPFYTQGEQFLEAIFVFISVIMSLIVLFMIVNTTSMTVMERTNEIGTARALGVQRSAIRWQFAIEGSMLGAIGATIGVILAELIGVALNSMNLSITIPGNSKPGPLQMLTRSEVWPLMGTIWVVLILVAIIAALAPANRGARLSVVDALRHV
jgi:putative ABC transport system permease protein